jgi:hypothetical protein
LLIHYSKKPIEKILSRPGARMTKGLILKPCGLWVSIGDAWRQWCIEEEYNTKALVCATEIILMPDAKILHLHTAKQIDMFTSDYSMLDGLHNIDWDRIAMQYQGIIIAPYCWQRRLTDHTLWYYGWDCASGCIWDAAAISSFRQLATEAVLS